MKLHHHITSSFAAFAALISSAFAVTIDSPPQAVEILQGDIAVFAVRASGTGALSYQWSKDGSPISGATSSALVLPSTLAGDAGNYTVEVSDAAPSSATSGAAALTFRTPVPGDVDYSFVSGLPINGTVYASAKQADGKVIIGGAFTTANGVVCNRLVRLNTDGSLDYSFGFGMSGPDNEVRSISVLADGKIFIGGAFSNVNGVARTNMARLNADGSLDESFSANLDGSVVDIVPLSDGKVMVGGHFFFVNGSLNRFVARLNADGTSDTTFSVGSALTSNVNTLAVQSDGKVVIGGNFQTYNTTARNRLMRLNSDGTLDTSFVVGTGANGRVNDVAIQPDGKIVVCGGFSSYNGNFTFNFIRVNSDGSYDSTFFSDIANGGAAETVTLQADGKILIGGGFTNSFGGGRNRVARVNANGSLDTTFGTEQGGALSTVYSLVEAGDGKVFIGGAFTTLNGGGRERFARLNNDGTIDASFGTGKTGANNTVSYSVIQDDGKIVLCGSFTGIGGQPFALFARVNANGTPDSTFSPATFSHTTSTSPNVGRIARLADGKFLVSGFFNTVSGNSKNHLARLNADGTFDATFATGLSGPNNSINALTVQPDGKILIGGSFSSVHGTTANRIARLNADGTLDTSFATGTGFSSGVNAIAVQPDGKLLVGGNFATFNGISRGRMARLNADGTNDASFGDGLSLSPTTVNQITVLPDGKILVNGGFSTFNGIGRQRIARLNADGTLDEAFMPTGAGANSDILTAAVQGDGKILIGGNFSNYAGVARTYFARLDRDGGLDTSITAVVPINSNIRHINIQPDGKPLIGGFFTTLNDTPRAYFARLQSDYTGGTGPVNNTPTDIALSAASLAENNAPGATIGTLTATDADASDTHTFTLVNGAGSDDNAAFSIVGNTLSINASSDFETKSSYAIRIRATDSGSPAEVFEKAFTVSISDVVEDMTPPVITTPGNLIVEAVSATGAVVNFTTSALDDVDGAVAAHTDIPSGAEFPFGTTTVNVTAMDAAGNNASTSFSVTVQDTTPPEIAVPADISETVAQGVTSKVVNFTTSATDSVDGPVSVVTSIASGSAFPLGETAVTLTATDARGNVAMETFTVTVDEITLAELLAAAQGYYFGGRIFDTTGNVVGYSVLKFGSVGSSVTGRVYMNGGRYAVNATLNATGRATKTLALSGYPSIAFVLQLGSDPNGQPVITADSASSGKDGDALLVRGSYQGATPPEAVGKWSVLLPGSTLALTGAAVPTGSGYASMDVATTGGIITMTGKTHNNTAFTVESLITDAGFEIYARPKPSGVTAGLITGTATFADLADSDFSGNITITRNAGGTGPYAGGFTGTGTIIGCRYTPAAAGTLPSPFTTTLLGISFQMPGKAAVVNAPFRITPGTSLVNAPLAPASTTKLFSLKTTATASTGVVLGTRTTTTSPGPLTINGIIYPKGARVEGFALDGASKAVPFTATQP